MIQIVKNFFNKPRPNLYTILIALARGLLCGVACVMTLALLATSLGIVGYLIGLITIGALGWLYEAYIHSEANGVRWFTTLLLGFMIMPYFCLVTHASLLATLLLTAGFVFAIDSLRSFSERVNRQLIVRYSVA
jgi:hypothetical protein